MRNLVVVIVLSICGCVEQDLVQVEPKLKFVDSVEEQLWVRFAVACVEDRNYHFSDACADYLLRQFRERRAVVSP